MRSRPLAVLFVSVVMGGVAPAIASDPPPGVLVGWGRDNYGQLSGAPAGVDFLAIDGGYWFSLALGVDGSIAAWGRNNVGQASAPAGNDFIAVDAGWFHGLGLRADHSLAVWGSDTWGQVSDAPAGNDFVAISAGGEHCLAVREDGSIAAWGKDNWGQVSGAPTEKDFVAVAAGGEHSLALRADGSIAAWGRNDFFQAWPPEEDGFVAITAGSMHSLALRGDGTLAAWGWDDAWGGDAYANPPPGDDYKAISAGGQHTVALHEDGSISAWGVDNYDIVSDAPPGNDFVAVAAGQWHSLALERPEPPGEFAKQAPADGAVGQSGQVGLEWGSALGADSYQYCVDTSDDDACASWVDRGAVTTAQLSGLTDATTYYWQVRADNPYGITESDGGDWWSFTTGPPSGFGKLSPVDGAGEQSGRALLSWEAVSGASSFEYCVDLSDDDACAAWTDAGTATSLQPVGLSYETTYFWQVRAVNGFGTTYADGGAWWSFTTKPTPPIEEMSFRSVAAYDGWVLERDEGSGRGEVFLAGTPLAPLGDDGADRQWRAILDFDTAALPDDAVVTGITLRIRREGLIGDNPFATHGMLKVDLQAGAYHGNPALERFDFHAVGTRGNVGRFIKVPADRWYRAPLREVAYPLLNLTGHTQFRLRFALDDDDDQADDCLQFYTGDAAVAADRPELTVSYYIP